jgi:hypothetical protein|tara:strand:+ start:171 stop:404 length:234 start_codon:yes stop_codon:yes gene_type:complete
MVYTNAVNLKDGMKTITGEVFALGFGYLLVSIIGQFITSGFNPQWYGYLGTLLVVSMSVSGGAYFITKVVYSIIRLG